MTAQDAKTAAILFSGGDASGMNTLLRSFGRIGMNRHHWNVLGIKNGYRGLVRTSDRIRCDELSPEQIRDALDAYPGLAGLVRRSQEVVRLDHASVAGLVGQGGTILGAARCEQFHSLATRQHVIALLASLGVDALVVVGGEGSLAGAARLAEESSLTVVGIPATIENDVHFTEAALGFDTAVSNIVWAVDRCDDTALSHQRIMVMQTMGRKSGELATEAALAAGVEIVVIPEQGPLTGPKMLGIAKQIEESMLKGQLHAIVLVAEGVEVENSDNLGTTAQTGSCGGVGAGGPAEALAMALCAHFGRADSAYPDVEVRHKVLGHLQRGGVPTVFDRILAVHYAQAAWQVITAKPPRSGVVGWRQGRVVHLPFNAPSDVDLPRMARKYYLIQKAINQW